MKTFRHFILMLLASVLSFGFVACDKDDMDSSDLVGTWYVTRVAGYEMDSSESGEKNTFDIPAEYGDSRFTFTEKNTYEIVEKKGEKEYIEHGTWSLSGDKLSLIADDWMDEATIIKLNKSDLEFSFFNKKTVEGVTMESLYHFYLVK